MIIKNMDLSDGCINSLNLLIEMDLNASEAFKISRIIRELNPILEDKIKFERAIVSKHAQKDEAGNIEHPKDESGNIIESQIIISDTDAFNAEMSEFLNIEIEVSFDKLDFSNLNITGGTLKPRDLSHIDFLFI